MKGIVVSIITLSLAAKEIAALSYKSCDSDSIPASTKASNLVPNQFHKLCPGVPNSAVGGLKYPICGDGTPFSFFFAKPTQRKMNTNKLLIEFMGGGACWDANTCQKQQSYLTFPEKLNNFVGYSCSEINAAQGDSQFNILCSQSSVGGVDFTEYNTVIVPYCTQDVFVGSQSMTYDDGSVINHVGGANTMAVMDWVFENFPNPSHIVLTGCSAGGTALPIAYDMLNMHYNRWTRSPPGMRSVQISTVADSSVYLTPTYFLENAFGNWDPSPIMKKLSFPFNKYKNNENYSTEVWNHVLKRGPNSDKWGFITYNNDPISQMYYSYMGGMYADDDGYNGRQLEDVSDAWWSSLSGSLTYVQKRHKNVQTFIMDGEGHCTFGWYYAIQQDGFDDWIKNIIQEKTVYGRTSSATPLFAIAAVLGGLIAFGAMNSRKKRDIGVDDGVLLNDGEQRRSPSQLLHSTFAKFSGFCTRFSDYPITAGYFAIVTIYFVTMLVSQGFAHPVNNPSLGPGATSLSSFGINNPSLIVYNFQLIRLITSGFLCSGILTFTILAITLHRHTRNLEKEIGSSKEFCILAVAVMLGSNLIYACVAGGASCATIATVLGMNTLSIFLPRKTTSTSSTPATPKPICSTITIFIIATLVLPFNSWVINLSSICVALSLCYTVVERQEQEIASDLKTGQSLYTAKRGPLKGFFALCLLSFFFLAVRIIRPNRLYTSPFLTGCDLTYVELPSDIAGSFYGSRRLEADGDGGDTLCAEFCVPHIAARPLVWGASTYSGYTVSSGQCQDNGYDTHIADKTFSKATYSVDVEVYTNSNNGYN